MMIIVMIATQSDADMICADTVMNNIVVIVAVTELHNVCDSFHSFLIYIHIKFGTSNMDLGPGFHRTLISKFIERRTSFG